MSDSYYVLLDDTEPTGERFAATDLVRSTWTAAIQHAAPVSSLLVRALERCEQRDDTRLSRVVVDLLGPVPVEGDLWLLALGPGNPRPVARASGWRFQQMDTADVVRATEPPPRLRSEGRSLEWIWLTKPLNDGPGESWIRPTVELVKGETMTPLERLFAVADVRTASATRSTSPSGRS